MRKKYKQSKNNENRNEVLSLAPHLFDAVAVVNVDVDVEHARVRLQQLEYREHNVVDVAKSCKAVQRIQPA